MLPAIRGILHSTGQEINTSQWATMLSGWEVKAGMARIWWQVKLCDSLYNVSYLSAL